MEYTPNIELTDVSGIGDNLAEHFQDEGFETANDIADASVHDVQDVKTIGETRATELISEAKTLVNNESYVNRQWDPVTEEYYDAGQRFFECDLCETEFGTRAVYLTHRRNCERYQ